MCIISRSEIQAFSANAAEGNQPKKSDPVAEAVKEIFQNLANLKLTSNRYWDNGTTVLFRNYLTDKLTSCIKQEGFDVEKFKASEIDKFKSIQEEIKLKNRILRRIDDILVKYSDDPHYRMVMIFLHRNKDTIKSLLQKNVTDKEITKEGLQKFKTELLNLVKSQFKTLYPDCVLKNLDCLDELLSTTVSVENLDEFHLKILNTIELETLVILVREAREQRISKSNGTCFGDSLLAVSPLFEIGKSYSGSFFQFAYTMHNKLEEFYDPERSNTGKEILQYPQNNYPRLRSLACKVLNCSESDFASLNSQVLENVLGGLAVMAIKGSFTNQFDDNALYNIRYSLSKTKSTAKKAKEFERQQVLGYWVFHHKETFPEAWKYHTCFLNYKAFGNHLLDLMFYKSVISSQEKEKLKNLYRHINSRALPTKILNKIFIREFHYHVIEEQISLLSEGIRKCAANHNRYILSLHSKDGGHAIMLALGETFSFVDPNNYNPATCFSDVVNYQNIDEFISVFVTYLATMYEAENYLSFTIQSASTIPETEIPEIKLRKLIRENKIWMQSRDDFIQKIDAKARLLIVDKTLTPKERDELKSELENGRLELESNGARLIHFHDQLKDMILQRIQYYENKLKSSVNPKLQQSYQRVINSYHSLIGQLCVNPQAVVRYTAQ